MFNRNKSSESAASKVKNATKPVSHRNNMFSMGTVVKGELTIESEARIEGKVIGTIHSKSKLAIGETGLVEGDIDCKTAMIEGTVKGTLNVEELLVISKTARIEGDIRTQKLVVEEGANISSSSFSAGITITTDKKGIEKDLIRPQLTKQA